MGAEQHADYGYMPVPLKARLAFDMKIAASLLIGLWSGACDAELGPAGAPPVTSVGGGLQTQQSGTTAPSNVAGTTWRVTHLGDQAAPPANPPDAIVRFFANGNLAGMLNCNGIGGAAKWTADGRFLNMSAPLISTLIGCEEGSEKSQSHAFAEEFWRRMHIAERWQLAGDTLLIHFADGSTAQLKQTSMPTRDELFPGGT